MKWREAPVAFRIYLFALIGALAYVLVDRFDQAESHGHFVSWIILTILLALSEFVALSIHTRKGRYNLSSSEAVLMPMFVALSFPQVIIAALVANAVARPSRWRLTPVQEAFNVAQYGFAAMTAAAVWEWLHEPAEGLTARNGGAAALATIVFAVSSHILVAAGIALARKGRFKDLSLDVAPTFFANLAAELIFGALLTASFYAAEWTVGLFFMPLGALFFGYRAVVSQMRERERVEHLHAATRALASTPDLEQGVLGFLRSAADIASSKQAWAVIPVHGELFCSGVEGDKVLHSLSPVSSEAKRVLEHLRTINDSLVIGEDEAGRYRQLAVDLDARSLVAAPLWVGDRVAGCLIAIDRVGPENFGDADARLLEAIGAELMVSLDAYRLFAEVAEERERFSRIFAGSKEGICLLDSDGVVRAWNPALERITGYPSTEVMGAVWSKSLVIRDKDQTRLEADELIGAEPDEELELVTKTGPSRWVSVIAGPVGEAEGGGWVVLMRDVTAEHEVEAAKSDFLSTISHELRTPLTTIKGSLQVLSRGTENLPDQVAEQMIGVTTRGAERLERLVMNLLAVSQLESGTMPIFPDEVVVEDLVRDRADALLKDHNNKIIEGSAQRLVVRADRERLSQAVDHLLENAIKFGGAEGQITIAVTRDAWMVKVAISDEGPGIPPADRERVFERFIRLGDVLTRETQGAGVGLFIAARSLQAMEGRIWVDENEAGGSTFCFTLPLAHPVTIVGGAEGA
jgi:PAS domain S-box-containing protein